MRQISQGVGDIDMQKAGNAVAENNVHTQTQDVPLESEQQQQDASDSSMERSPNQDDPNSTGLDLEKGLKRKMGDRAVSIGPNDTVKAPDPSEPSKRTREAVPSPDRVTAAAVKTPPATPSRSTKPVNMTVFLNYDDHKTDAVFRLDSWHTHQCSHHSRLQMMPQSDQGKIRIRIPTHESLSDQLHRQLTNQ